ncbi:MAG: Omp28-related outer membrane protein [Putridiphycobacter sp.]|nr:Omp28-related outer membrane protein [Putridiphycobacter sp.]
MKTIANITIFFFSVFAFFSCDKIEKPYIIITELDTTLYDGGNFENYVPPSFDVNTNTERNILIEDFTGHQCIFCPAAADVAKAIEDSLPTRVFVATIHAAPTSTGTSPFQEVKTSGNKYTTDFTTPEGKEIAAHLANVQGASAGNPVGTVSRVTNNAGEIYLASSAWKQQTIDLLDTDLTLNIQAKSSYFSSTRGVFIHTQMEFLEDVSGEFAVVIYAIDNEIIDWQKNGGQDIPDYKHHNVHIGNVFAGESFGRTFINGAVEAGQKFEKDFSYQLPADLPKEDMHFLIFVVDKGTEEVLQVIKHEI